VRSYQHLLTLSPRADDMCALATAGYDSAVSVVRQKLGVFQAKTGRTRRSHGYLEATLDASLAEVADAAGAPHPTHLGRTPALGGGAPDPSQRPTLTSRISSAGTASRSMDPRMPVARVDATLLGPAFHLDRDALGALVATTFVQTVDAVKARPPSGRQERPERRRMGRRGTSARAPPGCAASCGRTMNTAGC
jgi:hypothetical protein